MISAFFLEIVKENYFAIYDFVVSFGEIFELAPVLLGANSADLLLRQNRLIYLVKGARSSNLPNFFLFFLIFFLFFNLFQFLRPNSLNDARFLHHLPIFRFFVQFLEGQIVLFEPFSVLDPVAQEWFCLGLVDDLFVAF